MSEFQAGRAPQIKDSSSSLTAPIYRYTRYQPYGSLASFAVGASRQRVTFRIDPSTPINLARSYLNFSSLYGATGAGDFTKVHVGYCPVARIYVSANGVELAQVPDDVWSIMDTVTYATTRVEDFAASPSGLGAATLAGTGPAIKGLQPARSVAAMAAGNSSGGYPMNASGVDSGVAYALDKGPAGPDAPQTIISAPDNTALALNWSVPLSRLLPHSILALDRDLAWPTASLNIEIDFAPLPVWAYTGNSVSTSSRSEAYAGALAVSDVSLNVAVQRDADLAAQLMAKVTGEGIDMLAPYPRLISQPVGTATSGAVQQVMSSGDGMNLQRVYWMLRSNTGTEAGNNVAGELVTSYYSQINGTRLQPEDVQSGYTAGVYGTDWDLNQQLVAGSALTSERSWRTHWFHVDEFAQPTVPLWTARELSDVAESGYPLTTSAVLYAINFRKAATDARFVGYAVLQRRLRIRGNEVSLA